MTWDLTLMIYNLWIESDDLRLDMRLKSNDLRLESNNLRLKTWDLTLMIYNLRLESNDLRLDVTLKSNDLRLDINFCLMTWYFPWDLTTKTCDLYVIIRDMLGAWQQWHLCDQDKADEMNQEVDCKDKLMHFVIPDQLFAKKYIASRQWRVNTARQLKR